LRDRAHRKASSWFPPPRLPAAARERGREIRRDILAGGGPFDHDVDVIGPAAQRIEQRPILFEPPPALHDLLRLRLVAPEIWSGNAGLYFAELLIEVCSLKDASGVPSPACASPRNAA
jgi:hypothetical protein